MGNINNISTKLEQILCSRGYTDQLAGICGALIFLAGYLASFPMGFIVYKTKRPVLVCKVSLLICLIFIIMLAYFLPLPNHTPSIIISCVLLGIFGLGPYPIFLDLITECTYPINEVNIHVCLFLGDFTGCAICFGPLS